MGPFIVNKGCPATKGNFYKALCYIFTKSK